MKALIHIVAARLLLLVAAASISGSVTAQQTTASANLVVTKEATVPLGNTNQAFIINVFNTGPETAFGTVITDALPPGSNATSASATLDGTTTACTVNNGIVVCDIGDLQSGDGAVITLETNLTGTGAVINTAVGRHRGPDFDPTNDAGSAIVLLDGENIPTVNLEITKTDFPDPVEAGNLVTFTIRVVNEGTTAATGVTVVDTLPSGTELVASSNPGVVVSNGVVIFTIGTLAPGASNETLLTIRANNPGRIANSAGVSGNEPSANPVNTVREFGIVTQNGETTGTGQAVDLSLVKTDSPDPVQAENLLTFNIVVTNNSLTSATGVLVTDELPDEVTFESAETNGTGTCSRNGQTVTCNLGTLEAGETTNVQILVRPNQTGIITNTATVSSNEPELSPGNNTDTEQTTVVPRADRLSDLSIVKSTQDTQTTVGQNVTFQINVTNNGPDAANSVIVTDTLPANSTFVSATPSDGSCSRAGNTLTCNLGTINSGQAETIQVVVQATSPGTLSNTATVRSNSTDGNQTNNSSTASTTVNPPAGGGDACPDLTIVFTEAAVSKCRNTRNGIRCRVRGRTVVKNIGNAPADKSFVCFFLSDDPVLDSGDQLVGFKRVRKLNPDRSKRVRINAKAPFRVNADGKFLIAVADCGDTLFPECSEDNNTAVSGPITPRVR